MQGEFRGDFSRDTFHRFKHFTRVLMQQGRVQLDADWNEQAAILLRDRRALIADLLGPAIGPPGSQGFQITGARTQDFQIGAGPYIVDGILCEAGSVPVVITAFDTAANSKKVTWITVADWIVDGIEFQKLQYVIVSGGSNQPVLAQITDIDPSTRKLTLDADVSGFQNSSPQLQPVTTYLSQLDYPLPDPGISDGGILSKGGTYQVYLDVWERHITYVEDDCIREVALNGPDTSTRAKLVCQVKVTAPCRLGTNETGAVAGAVCCSIQQLTDTFQPPNRGRLKVTAKQSSVSTDPCIIAPGARYSGPENQLYRVEIHRSGTVGTGTGTVPLGAATFKWSRENGSVVFPIVSLSTGGGTTTVGLETLGRDDRFGLKEGEWVELQDDDYVLQNRTSGLLQVQSIDRNSVSVKLVGTPDLNVVNNVNKLGVAKHPLLRRWDHQAGDPAEGGLTLASDNAALVREGPWLALENGVQVQFQAPDSGQPPNHYRTSDYWLIPARTATGDVEWPIARDTQRNPILDTQGDTISIALPPHGIQHHYAPLAVITLDNNGTVSLVAASNGKSMDCRKLLNP